jgi:hypothetical protein
MRSVTGAVAPKSLARCLRRVTVETAARTSTAGQYRTGAGLDYLLQGLMFAFVASSGGPSSDAQSVVTGSVADRDRR